MHSPNLWSLAGAALLAALLGGCHGKGGDTASLPLAGHVWNGFDDHWAELSHRIAKAKVLIDKDGSVELGILGGDWSTGESWTDTLDYRVRTLMVSGDGIAIVHGRTDLVVGPDGHAETSATVTDPALMATPRQIVVLGGFAIDTDVSEPAGYPSDYDPASGYTSRGFGFGVSEPTASADGLTFTVSADVRWGPQDRADMNAAIPSANTGVTVAWTAIGLDGAVAEDELSATVNQPHDPPYSEQTRLGAADGLALPRSDGPTIAGLRAFDLLLESDDGSGDGDYLRSFGTEIVPDESGRPDHVEADLSNSSAIELEDITVTATVSVVRATPDSASRVTPVLWTGEMEVGETTVGP